MAGRQCEELMQLATQKLSEMIVNLCVETGTKKFSLTDLIQGKVSKYSSTFAALREQYILPISLQKEVLDRSFDIWTRNRKINKKWMDVNLAKWIGTRDETDFFFDTREEKVYLLIHYFCLNRYAEWKFDLKVNEKVSLHFLLNFNHNLKELWISKAINTNSLKNILSPMTNLVYLNLNYQLPESAFSVIGKFACSLKHLALFRNYQGKIRNINAAMAGKLCFQKYPGTDVKNRICTSLGVLQGQWDDEAIAIILQNFRTLKSMVNHHEFLHYNSLASCCKRNNVEVFPCSLQEICFDLNVEEYNMDDVIRDFPSLDKLGIRCMDLRPIKILENIQSLGIRCSTGLDNLPSFSLFSAQWLNLKVLSLQFSDQEVYFDFSDISVSAPNLENLYLFNCKQKAVSKFKPFVNLKELVIVVNPRKQIDEILLRYISADLRVLGILRCDTFITYEDKAAFKSILQGLEFPRLEYLVCFSLHLMKEDNILEFLSHFDSLETFGLGYNIEYSFRRELEKECKQRDLNLEFEGESCDLYWYFVY